MHPFTPTLIFYGLVTMASASTFYFSFRNHVDNSGRYFLLAELATLCLVSMLILSNTDQSIEHPLTLWMANVIGLTADTAVFFSIYSLDRHIKLKKFLWSCVAIIIYSTFIEILRTPDAKSSIFIYSIASAVIAWKTSWACQSVTDINLKKNQFLTCIRWIQFSIFVFSLLRIIACFIGIAVTPRNPSASATILFVIYCVLATFRYISYQSLRISWIDTKTRTANPLNKNLALAIEEKDHLLRGLVASNRVIGISALASSLAHQISQPLTSIALQTETLQRELSKSNENAQFVKSLDKMAQQLGKLSALVKNLRNLFNARAYPFDKIKLQSIANEILEIIEPSLNSKKIRLTKLYSSNPTVLGDAIQIQQVLINLFNNATDAIDSSQSKLREIKLSIDTDDDFAVISVEDSGDGIDPTLLGNMFELYKTTKKEGLGVGLWLSKTIIDKHQGIINVANGPQGGSIFNVQIPLAQKNK